MRSLAERSRRQSEMALRAGSIVLLAWMAWTLLRPARVDGRPAVVRGHELAASLRAATTDTSARALHVAFDRAPAVVARSWLTALRRTGSRVNWSGAEIPPLAVALEPIAEPRGGSRVAVASPERRKLTLRDDLGALDEAESGRLGASFAVTRVEGVVTIGADGHTARARQADSLRIGRVVVIGRASWETRFIAEALEERGWIVELRQLVAPELEALRGGEPTLDTGRVAVVVAADSTAERQGRRIAAYARAGGGVVLVGTAARAPSLSAIAPARVREARRPAELSFTAAEPRLALGIRPLAGLAPGAIILERRGNDIAAAAHRVGRGRVLLLGYEDSWRWRLSGGGEAPEAHRAWWSRVVASVAYQGALPRAADTTEPAVDPAPLAALHDALGASTQPPPPARSGDPGPALRWWMLALLFALLLAEWGSRRLRGAR